MPLLLLDHGNSRLKWALYHQGQWLSRGGVDKERLSELARHWQDLPRPTAIHGISVGSGQQRQGIEAACQTWGMRPRWHQSAAWLAGVTNGYQNPAQLGVDRLMAVIAAYHRYGAALVVMAGTATTIDSVNSQGYFLGGWIIPGLGLMRQSLALHTACLPWVTEGEGYPGLPARSTEEAIYCGTMAATLGAIEQGRGVLGGSIPVVLGGGYSTVLATHIVAPCYPHEDLALEGLAQVVSGPSDNA